MKLNEPSLAAKQARLVEAGKTLVERPVGTPEPEWAAGLGPADRQTIEQLHAGQQVDQPAIEAAYRAFVKAGGSPASLAWGFARLGYADQVADKIGGDRGIGSIVGAGIFGMNGAGALAAQIDWSKELGGQKSVFGLDSAIGDMILRTLQVAMIGSVEQNMSIADGETVRQGDRVRLGGNLAARNPALAGRALEFEQLYIYPLHNYVHARNLGIPSEQIAVGSISFKGGQSVVFASGELQQLTLTERKAGSSVE